MPKEDTLCRWRVYKLGNWKNLADQSTWWMEATQQNIPRQQSVNGSSYRSSQKEAPNNNNRNNNNNNNNNDNDDDVDDDDHHHHQ